MRSQLHFVTNMFWLQNYLNVEKMNNSLLNERDSYKSNILFIVFMY